MFPMVNPKNCFLALSEVCVDGEGRIVGEGIFTGSGFKSGEAVLSANRPLIGSLDTERLKDTCANCYVWTEGGAVGSRLYVKEGAKVQACAGCKRFRYCSKACQKEAWNRGHKHECKNLRAVSDKEIPKAVLGCMEVLVRRKHSLIDDSQWEMLCGLDPHLKDFKANGRYGGIELMALGTSQFSFTQDTFGKDFVAAMYARILSNSLTLVTPSFDPLGIMLDPWFCRLNHSCDPNAYIVMDGPRMELRALRDIDKHDEIYISYVDVTNSYARRQAELKERWFFTCRCAKCQGGPTEPEDEWAIQPKDLAEKWKDAADNIIKGSASVNEPANYVGGSTDEKRVAALQAEVWRLYEEEQREQDPNKAIALIEDGMQICHQSGLWPLHRQPFAALRDDLIVNLLAAGKYETAWAHCTKRERYITPTQHPQRWHPIRVVQTWQMAMLALYLASEHPTTVPGCDMGVMAAMLMRDAVTASFKSHGEESGFSKSIQLKFKEVAQELIARLGSGDAVDAAFRQHAQFLLQMGDLSQY